MSATRKPEMSRAQKAIERVHHKIMDMRDSTPMRDGSIEAEENYLKVYKKAYRESQSSTYFAAAERYRLFLQWKPVPGAPLQPGATQPEHDGVAHAPEKLFTHSELTTLLERMARLVVQEAVAICDEKDRLLKDDFETAKFLHTQSAIRALLAPGKLQQLREAVERP